MLSRLVYDAVESQVRERLLADHGRCDEVGIRRESICALDRLAIELAARAIELLDK